MTIRPHYRYKTEPRGKQREVVETTWDEFVWGLLCRPGTGKTKMFLDTAGMLWCADRIDALLVIAPDGVDRQWIKEGAPTHLSDDVPRVCGNYKSQMGKQAYEALLRGIVRSTKDKLKVLTISFDGVQTVRGKKLVEEFLRQHRVLGVDDESHRTSNPKTAASKAVKKVLRACRYRRIGTGTLIRQNPFSAYGQFDLLGDGLLGFSSMTAFKSMYAELLPKDNWLVQRISKQIADKTKQRGADGKLPFTPQIVATDDNGRPMFRNLPDLRKRLLKVASMLTLADVNGKEPVVNESTRYVQLTTAQVAVYHELQKYGVAQAPGGQLTADGALAMSIRLAQIAGGYAPSDDDPAAAQVGEVNPKVQEVLGLIEELGEGKLVIWCKFRAEIAGLLAKLREVYGPASTVEYHGSLNGKQKDAAKRTFIDDPACRFFVGQTRAGGTGLDGMQAVAQYMVFYSNDYPYELRDQAIGRLARTGGSDVVQVWDIVAEGTVDDDVIDCMRAAQDVSETVLLRAVRRDPA